MLMTVTVLGTHMYNVPGGLTLCTACAAHVLILINNIQVAALTLLACVGVQLMPLWCPKQLKQHINHYQHGLLVVRAAQTNRVPCTSPPTDKASRKE